MKRETKISIAFVALDLILFVVFMRFFTGPLQEIVGYDITEYENWYGTLENPVVYKFGIGCYEYLFVFIKAIVFIVLETIASVKNKGSKRLLVFAILTHIILLVLSVLYIYNYGEGWQIFELLKHFAGR